MFHEGDLQSGIAKAVAESKAVLCFVRDSTERSDEWENDFLKGAENAEAIQAHTVALRINHDSQEARYLGALCPISAVPVVVVIKNGTVQGRLENIGDREEFTIALRQALGLSDDISHGESGQDYGQVADENQHLRSVGGAPRPQADPITASHDNKVETSGATANDEEISPQADPLPGRSAQPVAATSAIDSQRTDYIAQQRQREAAQQAERRRIRESIEADRRERRKQADLGRSLAQPSTSTTSYPASQPAVPPSNDIRLAVRLHSGASIRSTFPPSATLSSTIRPWIRSHLQTTTSSSDANIPYTFKLILAPQPNRSISISEEAMTLEELLGDELGMSKSGGVTFVLVPEKTYADAYAGSGGGILGVPFRAAQAGGYGILGGVVSGLRYLTGYGGASSESRAQGEQDADLAGSSGGGDGGGGGQAEGVRIRTLADQRADANRRGDNAQLYNGNTLNFEPRRKKDDEGDHDRSQ